MYKFSKYVGSTSKFKAPDEWHEARTARYQVPSYKIQYPGDPAPGICAPPPNWSILLVRVRVCVCVCVHSEQQDAPITEHVSS